MVKEIIVDTSALIEYAFATEKGKEVKEIIEHQENVILVPSIVIGEFVSKLERSGVKNTEELIYDLGRYSVAIPVDWGTCFNAGKRHARLKKEDESISLVDCILMCVAEEHGNALILTLDRHFMHYKNSKIL
jgi:predicted nucleic acid-binding protein